MINLLKVYLKKLKKYFTSELNRNVEVNSFLIAKLHIQNINQLNSVESMEEVEFKVFSEWGEDGIVQYLINNVEVQNKIFIEFGVSDYKESNTRFLLMNNLWKGLIIDSDKSFMNSIKKEEIYWRYDLTAVHSFITRENINNIIKDAGFEGKIGILSIDIDGNDYWVWEGINTVDPSIVICEYNSIFGNKSPISIPYDKDFYRTNAHYSNLYFGASLPALVQLAERKGYDFVGSNSAGTNAFFVKKNLSGKLKKFSSAESYHKSSNRQSRNVNGDLSFLDWEAGRKIIEDMEVVNTETGRTVKLKEIFNSE